MFSAHIVTWIKNDWSHRPSSSPRPIVSKVASSVSIMEVDISVEPCTIPAALAITLWETSKTAITILNVLERMRMAQAVLNIHLKKIQ